MKKVHLRAVLVLAAAGGLVWLGGVAPALAQYSPPNVVSCTTVGDIHTGVAVGQYSAPVPAGLCAPVGGLSAPRGVPALPPLPAGLPLPPR